MEQELLELKQLYQKATGEAFGPPGKTEKTEKKTGGPKGGPRGAGHEGQKKQVDTKKADKEAKRVSLMSLSYATIQPCVHGL